MHSVKQPATAPFTAKLTNSQKYGLDIIEVDYVLTVIYDDENLKFNTSEGQTMESYAVAKKTDKYVIEESSGNVILPKNRTIG